MFGGMFGKRQGFTPPIVPPGMKMGGPNAAMQRGAQPMTPEQAAMARQMAQGQAPKKKGGMFSQGGKGWDALNLVGGMVRDASLSPGQQGGHFDAARNGIMQGRQQQEQEAEQAKRQQAMEQMLQGMTPEQRMAYQANPDAFGKAYSDSLFREQKPVVVGENSRLADLEGNVLLGAAPKLPEAITPYQEQQLALQRDRLEFDKTKPNKPLVSINNNPFGGGEAKSLQDIPVGQPIPAKLLGGINLPDDTYAVRSENGPGFEFATVPGSETARVNRSKQEAGTGREYGLGSLVRSYTTLRNNKAITSQTGTAKENLGALYSGTGLGKLQDAIGGDVGNNENITARNTIDGLSMKALMDMISMSDVSAKAMDSDAEMKAWLGAIKDDNYEAAMAKLHALDISFGGGDLMRKMFAEGELDQDTYQLVTNRAQTDPQTVAMMKKMGRYKGLEQSIGSDNLNPQEQGDINELLEFMSPEERALFGGE